MNRLNGNPDPSFKGTYFDIGLSTKKAPTLFTYFHTATCDLLTKGSKASDIHLKLRTNKYRYKPYNTASKGVISLKPRHREEKKITRPSSQKSAKLTPPSQKTKSLYRVMVITS